MKWRKGIACTLAFVAVASCISGCNKKENVNDGKVVISVGGWPAKDSVQRYATKEAQRKEFMEMYPDIVVEGREFLYDIKTYSALAAADNLPTIYSTWFTEVEKIVDNGYAVDISSAVDKYGFAQAMNPDLLEYVSDENGKFYGIPWNVYAQGLYINKKLFREAGLVDESGEILVPQTYDDVMEFSKIIREKTGKAGFAFQTANNCGGWNFMNIAWSYGVDFVEKTEDGKYVANFNNQKCIDAFEYIKKMKWEINAFPDNSVINQDEMKKIFGTNQAAMMISSPPNSALVAAYEMDINDIMLVRMPEGPEGRYSQMGGDLYMFSRNATPEQLDACMKWIEFVGESPNITDNSVEQLKTTYKTQLDNNGIVLPQNAFNIWVNEDAIKKTKTVLSEYTNVNAEDYVDYLGFDGVTIKPEVEVCCQELYSILDKVIQEIYANKNADIPSLVAKANEEWQINHLNNLE